MNKNLNTLLTVFLLLNTCLIQAKLSISEKPDWVIDHQPQIESSGINDYSSSYLMFDQQLYLSEQSQFDYSRIVVRINNSQGLKDMGELSISFDPIYQTLQVHHVNIIRNDKIVNVLEEVEFEVIRQENELDLGIYNGKKTALLLLEDLQVNDILDYGYTITGKNPIFKNHVFEYYGLEWSIPVKDLHIIISAPKDTKIKYKTHKGNEKAIKKIKGNRLNYTWHLENIEAVDVQGSYPKWYVPLNFLELSEFKNWKQVAQWATQVFTIDLTLDNEIHTMINSWQENNKDSLSKVAEALKYVQNEIRYLGIEIGVNSHKPRLPNETYATKYGDCKDKTMLLHALLNAMDINSSPILVSTDLNRGILDRLPSPGLFNHVILQIEIEGHLYWVDPTVTDQGGSLTTIGLPDFAYGLVVDNQTKSLSPITRFSTQVNHKTTTEKLEVKAKKSTIELIIETEYVGQFAEYWRSNLKAGSLQQTQKQFESHTNQMYGSAFINQNLVVNDDLEKNKLVVIENYQLEDPWKQNKSYEYIEMFAYSLLSYVELPNRINRDTPLGLPFPLKIEHQFIINDDSNNLEYDNQPIEENSEYLKYKKTVTKNKKNIIITHQLEILKDHVSVKDLKHYFDIIKLVKKNLSVVIGLPIQKKTRLKESNDRLMSVLQEMLKEKSDDKN